VRIGLVRNVTLTDTWQWTTTIVDGMWAWSHGRRLTPLAAARAMYASLLPGASER
jgi:hypothetical protein